MVRRTKEEAQATRHKLLDAAEYLFQLQGVSRTSLQDIARRADATRGAVYWHFKDKADLFNAMMERVTLPMEESFDHRKPVTGACAAQAGGQALQRIRESTFYALNQVATDCQTRRVMEVATQKVEYVEELQAVRLRHLAVRNSFVERIEESMLLASREAGIRLTMAASMAAQGLHALIGGLIQNWLLDPTAFDLVEVGRCAIDTYLQGLGFAPPAD